MSTPKQCPSTIGTQPAETPRADQKLWRSLDDLAGTPEFNEFLTREFPAHASELTDPTRRSFLRVMGASLALAGAATIPGCRRPDHRILPYARQPEDIIEGKPLFYATAMPLPGGGAEGLLVETHEGRPTKIEGNPLHPINQGRTSIWAQASVLNLYDPDRLAHPSKMGEEGREDATWEDFERAAKGLFRRFKPREGAGLVFLVDKKTSPTRDRLRDQLLKKLPKAKWLPYEAIDNDAALDGARQAFGQPMLPLYDLSKAKVIVSIDRDFLSGENASLPEARTFAAGRRVLTTGGATGEMNRLYTIESGMSLTGASADHRLRLKPSQIPGYTLALAKAVIERLGSASAPISKAIASAKDASLPSELDHEWVDAVADDLVDHRGASVLMVGPAQPAAVHALAHAVNSALGSMGKTVSMQPARGDAAASSVESIRELTKAINAGSIETLVVLNANPVYDAPADLGLHELWKKIPTTVQLSVDSNETGMLSTWRLNGAHFLESWSDVTAADGSMSIVQPMIAPLFHGRNELELLALILETESRDAYELVRQTWREQAPGMQSLSDSLFDKRWNRALHNGVLERSAIAGSTPSVNAAAIASAASSLAKTVSGDGLEVVFHASRTLYDGRHANNGWLQELPDPVSKVTWDNPVLLSAATAKRLDVIDGDVIELSVGKHTVEIPVFRQPGMADDTIAISLGGGREESGRIGVGPGVNTHRLRSTGAMRTATGASLTNTGKKHSLASVQDHWSMEGRPLIREFDVQAWRKHGDAIITEEDHYGGQRHLTFAQRSGTEAHAPVNRDIYKPSQEHPYKTSPQWGMTIDLTTCSGCGACTIACQAENNIPVVGKYEVIKGREMHWIRVDRYYSSADTTAPDPFDNDYGDAGPFTGGRKRDDVDMLVQPVPCMHCEEAPCETVCPVNATTHGPEGTNDMAYNRCIGTRYCANNCPYKVRRFNFFDYATKRLHGDYPGKDKLKSFIKNEQLVPPRLRERIEEGTGEVQTMQYNPNVTVRERGVMEKCTYCIQRVNSARVETQLLDLTNIPDGFFETACQQACPSESIVFGDISDPLSKVRQLRDNKRAYAMLDYLNVRPRTTYLARLRNTNPRLREPVIEPFHHGAEHDPSTNHDPSIEHEPKKEEGHVMSLPILLENGALA